MKILFIVTSSDMGYWLPELTRPYWHVTERGHEVTIASPKGGKVKYDGLSNPNSEGSWESNDLVSKGFLSNVQLTALLENTTPLEKIRHQDFDAAHVVGGTGAAVDLFPNEEVARILGGLWEDGKLVGAICHGTIALGNLPEHIRGKRATGFSLVEDLQAEQMYGKGFIPNFPQPVLEAAGIEYFCAEPWNPRVVVDGKLVTGQNQQSASEYSLQFNRVLTGNSPVLSF
jgi:putative intracellular protease/amidase